MVPESGDAGTGDSGTGDSGTGDSGTVDSGTVDAGAFDAGTQGMDAGMSNDGGSCVQLQTAFETLLNSSMSCMAASDCVIDDQLPCQLAGCYAPVNQSQVSALAASAMNYNNAGCPGAGCECTTAPTGVDCMSGTCVALYDEADAGQRPDAGPFDAGESDAGRLDGGSADAGSCMQLDTQFQSLVQSSQTCAANRDCAIDMLPCGTVGECSAVLNVTIETDVTTVVDDMEMEGCHYGAGACSCVVPPGSAYCDGGVCMGAF